MLKLKKTKGRRNMTQKERHIPIKPSTGFVAKAVRSFYNDLFDACNDDPQFQKTAKLASRSYNDLESLRDPSCPLKKSRGAGAGRKV